MIEFLAQIPTDTMIFIANGSSGFGGNADSAETADLRLLQPSPVPLRVLAFPA
jgi:hypothetical protein